METLKPFVEDDGRPVDYPNPDDPEETRADEGDVDDLLDVRATVLATGKLRLEYLVWWSDGDPDEWIAAEHVRCPSLAAKFVDKIRLLQPKVRRGHKRKATQMVGQS